MWVLKMELLHQLPMIHGTPMEHQCMYVQHFDENIYLNIMYFIPIVSKIGRKFIKIKCRYKKITLLYLKNGLNLLKIKCIYKIFYPVINKIWCKCIEIQCKYNFFTPILIKIGVNSLKFSVNI